MIVLEAAQTIGGVAGTATAITYTVEGMKLLSTNETYESLAQGQLPLAAGTLYTVPGSTQVFIKSIHLVNATGSVVSGIKLFIGGTAGANQITGALTLQPNSWAVFDENGWRVYDGNGATLVRSN